MMSSSRLLIFGTLLLVVSGVVESADSGSATRFRNRRSPPPPPSPTSSPPPPSPTSSPPPPSPTSSPPPPSPTSSPPPPSPTSSPPPPSPTSSPPPPPPTSSPPPPPTSSPPPPPTPSSNATDPVDFYTSECPSARAAVGQVVSNAIAADKGLPAALLRLQFHDCFVRGCDASILLQSNQTHLAEKDGVGNAFSVRGYEMIDEAKTAVENICPGVVSCADIIALSARDAIAAIGGPAWRVVSGRRDGLDSNAVETPSNLPPPFADYAFLVSIFAKKGFTEEEMVVLSGSHTIGVTHCGLIEARLYNGTGPDGVDPTLDSAYATQLKQQCPFGVSDMVEVLMDPTLGGNTFDSTYYTNVMNKKGLFTSDASLVTTASGSAFVQAQAADPRIPFISDFGAAMEKMINLQTLQAPQGQIRKNCRFTN